MLEIFIFLLCLVAVYLVSFGLRELTNMIFHFTADVTKTFEEQTKAVRLFQRANMFFHHVMIYSKVFGSLTFAVWVILLAIAIR